MKTKSTLEILEYSAMTDCDGKATAVFKIEVNVRDYYGKWGDPVVFELRVREPERIDLGDFGSFSGFAGDAVEQKDRFGVKAWYCGKTCLPGASLQRLLFEVNEKAKLLLRASQSD